MKRHADPSVHNSRDLHSEVDRALRLNAAQEQAKPQPDGVRRTDLRECGPPGKPQTDPTLIKRDRHFDRIPQLLLV
jgi:hypothetical protein